MLGAPFGRALLLDDPENGPYNSFPDSLDYYWHMQAGALLWHIRQSAAMLLGCPAAGLCTGLS